MQSQGAAQRAVARHRCALRCCFCVVEHGAMHEWSAPKQLTYLQYMRIMVIKMWACAAR